MAVKWTTAAIVRTLLQDCTTIADADIQEIIEEWEGWAEANYDLGSVTFSSSKKNHLLVRNLVTHMAALDLLIGQKVSFESLSHIGLVADLLADQIQRLQKILDDRSVSSRVRNA